MCPNINCLMKESTTGKKAHRTPKNLYIVNLAVSGISMCVICIPPTLIQCLYGGKWFLGLAACKLVPAIQGMKAMHHRTTAWFHSRKLPAIWPVSCLSDICRFSRIFSHISCISSLALRSRTIRYPADQAHFLKDKNCFI